jgi:hypothetical protein
MFKAVYLIKEIGAFATLQEAAKAIFKKVREDIAAKRMTWQTLETIWVERPNERLPMMFYDLRDHAAQEGWIDGQGNWLAN